MNDLLAEAAARHPDECCGLLLGDAQAITAIQPAANVHPTPQTHFEIDPASLIAAYRAERSGGPQIAGYYHSHPGGCPEPSATDQAMAARDGKIWAIVGECEVGMWRDAAGGFAPLSYAIGEG